MFFGIITGIGVVVSATTKGIKAADGNRYVKPYVKTVDGNKLRDNNANGTINGLNLLLIDSIKTEGYVKEYLTLARDNADGKLNDNKEHIPLQGVVGIAMGEQGGYYGTLIPKTVLPWDDSSNSPLWDKSKGITLSEVTSFSRDDGILSFDPGGSGENSGYAGPFQQTESYFSGAYLPSNMLGYKLTQGRSNGNWAYFPDQLSGLDYEYTSAASGVNVETLDPKARLMMTSFNHNIGPGYKNNIFSFYNDSPENLSKGIDLFYNHMNSSFEKYRSQIASINVEGWLLKGLSGFLLMESGWNLSNRQGSGGSSYDFYVQFKSKLMTIFTGLGLGSDESDYDKYINSHVEDIDWITPVGSTWGNVSYTKNGEHLESPFETIGHSLGAGFMGEIYYAHMLKFAGVGVDPTDPNTYMNTLPEGEWKPSGNSAWMGEYKINPSEIGPERTNILNEAHQWIGSWYSYEGTPPPKNDDGSWANWPTESGWGAPGFDCSSLVQYSYQKIKGIDIGRSTWNQRDSGQTEIISKSEAKPGDLIYYWGPSMDWGHVAIYLGNGSGDNDIILHSPQPMQRIGITETDGWGIYTIREYRRVKGMN